MNFIAIAFLQFFLVLPLRANRDCNTIDSIVLTTGPDGTVDSLHHTDFAEEQIRPDEQRNPVADWIVVSDPDPQTAEPRAVNVVEKHPVWYDPLPGSRWASAYPTAMNAVIGTYVLQTRFCAGTNARRARIRMIRQSDDNATIYLNGVLIGSATTGEINADISRYVKADNVLEVHLTNTAPEAMGLNIRGEIIFEPDNTNPPEPDAGILSTGWSHGDNRVQEIGETSRFWTVANDPDPETVEPRPAQVIEQYPGAWAAPLPGSQWIGPYPTSTNYTNGTYLLTAFFCAKPNAGNVRLHIGWRADDSAAIFVNGYYLGSTTAEAYTTENYAEIDTDISQQIRPGRNRIEVRLVNVHSYGMGLNIAGRITADDKSAIVPDMPNDAECRFCEERK